MNENELLKLTYPVGKFEWNEKPNKKKSKKELHFLKNFPKN